MLAKATHIIGKLKIPVFFAILLTVSLFWFCEADVDRSL